MGGPTQRGPQQRETAQDVFVRELAARGFDADQARQIIDIVQRMRAGQHVVLNAVQSNWVSDINAINDAWSRVSGSTRRISQLSPQQAAQIFGGQEMRDRDRARKIEANVAQTMDTMAATMRARPAQTTSFIYEVEIQGQTYTLQLNRRLTRTGGMYGMPNRVRELEDLIAGNPGAVLAVTLPDGSTVRPGTPGFNTFQQTYVQNYTAMSRELAAGQDSDRISIHFVRRTGET